jgi:7-cyano-7-deazaguanine synthase
MINKIYPLLSGGIDSTIAAIKKIKSLESSEIQPIFIDYGQKAHEQEWNSVLEVSRKLAKLVNERKTVFKKPKRIVLSCTTSQDRIFQWSRSRLIIGNVGKDPYVENRNMILISAAASYAESQIEESQQGIIITGFRDEYSDTRREFVSSLNSIFKILLAEKRKTIRIEAPIIDYGPTGKGRLLFDFQKYKEIIDLTWSCYEPEDGKPCKKCQACTGRKDALIEAFGKQP